MRLLRPENLGLVKGLSDLLMTVLTWVLPVVAAVLAALVVATLIRHSQYPLAGAWEDANILGLAGILVTLTWLCVRGWAYG